MTRITPIIHYFKVASPLRELATPRKRWKRIREQSEIVPLSSDEENEADNSRENSGLPELKALPTMEKVIISTDDSESGTSSGVTCVTKCSENTAEKRKPDDNEENLLDSQDVLPKRKRRSTGTRITDSEDENGTQETEGSQVQSQNSDEWLPEADTEINEYSSDTDSSDADEYEIDTDEEDRLNSYEEPDPRYLYEGTQKRKKSKKTKQASYDDNNQEVSIHKINLNHPKLARKTVEKVIKTIVEMYNKGKDSSTESKSNFEERPVHCKPVVKPEDKDHFTGDRFHVKAFVQKVAPKISLLHSYGIKENSTAIHSLIFHYRENDLFAITTNQAWNVVQWCSDFEFPGKIAARILSRDGELQSTNKGLVGTELTRRTTHKQQKKTNPHDLVTLCTRFTAELREDASILKLSCFQKNNAIADTKNGAESNEDDGEGEEEKKDEEETQTRKPLSKGAKVVVSLGNIRILKKLSTSDILSILSILSEISNGKETRNLNGDVEENSTAHNKYLTRLHTERAHELNLCLSKIIHDAIADDNRMAELDNYQLCHKHSSDFFRANNFKLWYKGAVIKVFSEIPTIKQIVIELRSVLGEVADGTSNEAFLQRLNNAKISYRFGTSDKEKKPEKLMNFIDGLLCHSTDNSVFWHAMGMWCHVQDGYINLVHNQFKKTLNDYLLTDKSDPAYLCIPWLTNENTTPETKLKHYLTKFSSFPNAWTSERPERDIADMIRLEKNSDGRNVFFVYYFLPGLNNQTNVKCNRVAESIMQIGKASMQRQNQNADVAGSEDVKKQLNAVYQKLLQKPRFEDICPNLNHFYQMMTEAKFYLAIGRDVSTTPGSIDVPSLENENVMSKEISSRGIATILDNLIDAKRDEDLDMLNRAAAVFNERFDKCGGERLAKLIHNELIEHEYIEADGNSIRGKLLSIGRNNFSITNNGRVNQFLYDKIIAKFQPRACTVLSKLGFFVFREEIPKLTIASFNLIEIPLQYQ